MKKNMNASFRLKDIGKEVELFGWVARKRSLGGLVFIDLRDRSNNSNSSKTEDEAYKLANL